MQEAITLTISQGYKKQKFILSASEILKHVENQKILKAFNSLDIVLEDLEKEKRKLAEAIEEVDREEIEEELNLLEARRDHLERYIKESDDTTNNLQRILRNIFQDEHMEADLREAPLIIYEEIFEGSTEHQNKVLPSVKLMEKDSKPLYMPTDTAPSRIFQYAMIQRLVEPAISPIADKKNGKGRIALTQGVDVMNFKKIISTSPDQWPQMSSLGIGYVLNMHQAWVPDGFALGNLLYSLVLAPGEEQRLVVREKNQSYEIIDELSGEDAVVESYEADQMDNTTAAYDYAVRQMMEGSSKYSYSTRASTIGASLGLGGIGGGISAMFGLSGSTAKSSGKGSSSASQSNTHNEASNAAQMFQHGIKTASERISQARRLGISMASGDEKDSVATRIIANHNHSHTMTIQYWEVMRRYRLETCVDHVDLVLFVPMKLIPFLNGQTYLLGNTLMTPDLFKLRYEKILQHADTLVSYLPRTYRTGLNLMKEYAAYPGWNMEQKVYNGKMLEFTFKGVFLSFDDVNITLVLKHGKGRIAGSLSYTRLQLNTEFETSASLKEAITAVRNGNVDDISNYTNSKQKKDYDQCRAVFTLPADISEDDLAYIQIDYSPETLHYELHKKWYDVSRNGEFAFETYRYMMDKTWDLAKDRKDSDGDIRKIDYCKEMLPEAWVFPNVTISSYELKNLGTPQIKDMVLKMSGGNGLTVAASRNDLRSSICAMISTTRPVLQYEQLQKMEETLHHIVSNTMYYSQRVWASLSSDERALMLEQFTIDMDLKEISNQTDQSSKATEDISLLNCIDVKKLLGFYGNCMLFPFTYPQKLADRLGKTAGELQDSLYRYHTNYFRVPTTTISLPTDGMIGEAVLGETNVSEEIDLTRFWNWKDSPIDSMPIDSSYLNGTDYLAGKGTKDIQGMNLQSAAAATPVTAADLISALVAKQTPSFDNITGLDQLKDVLNQGTKSAANGRDKALQTSSDMAKAALDVFKGISLGDKNASNSQSNGEQESDGENNNHNNGDSDHTHPNPQNPNKPQGDNGNGQKPVSEGENPIQKPQGSDGGGLNQQHQDGENSGQPKPVQTDHENESPEHQNGEQQENEDPGNNNQNPNPVIVDESEKNSKDIDYDLFDAIMEEMFLIYSSDPEITPEQCIEKMGSGLTISEAASYAEQFFVKHSVTLEPVDSGR